MKPTFCVGANDTALDCYISLWNLGHCSGVKYLVEKTWLLPHIPVPFVHGSMHYIEIFQYLDYN